ncbi:P-loop NTPase fold protein [Proteiniphilum sp.]|uniref:P-loop NTPase fold protein n=1 Tax=Proteiniphilum sp. TaxID=1926877 RepID=UPI0033211A92
MDATVLNKRLKIIREWLLKNRNNWLIFFLLLIFVIVTRDFMADILDKIWVKPFMSKMYEDALCYSIAASLVLIIYYISCCRERVISKPRILILGTLFIIYLSSVIYSCTSNEHGWFYKSFNDSKNMLTYYVTLLYAISLIGELYLYKRRHTLQRREDSNCSLIYETPVKKEEEDSYKRRQYAEIVAQKINDNFHKEGSFVIGITGNWGSGKTSFLNLIKLKLGHPDVDNHDVGAAADNNSGMNVIFEFKPWLSSSANNIITDFFAQLSKDVSGYIPNFTNQLTKYVDALSDLTATEPIFNNGLKVIRRGLSESTVNRYEKIKEILEKSKLKTLIFVDDTDRLSEEEILELFRLVRNTANFPYLQFVITYDRDYLIKTLKVANPEKYMEKIFNLEITLPTFDSGVIREFLWEEVNSKLINQAYKQAYKDVIRGFLQSFEDEFPVEKLIRTRRDVIRFTNAFIINIEALSKSLQEINILDLFKLELIRYRYPAYYDLLSQDPLSELGIYNDTYRYKKGQIKENEQSALNEKLQKIPVESKILPDKRHKYISPENVVSVCMDNLFPKTPLLDYNSISRLRAFDQYFRYRYDEKNITVSEAILLLQESNATKQLQQIEDYYSNKREREIFHMVESFISKWEATPKEEEKQLPFYYKTILAFLSAVMNSEKKELIEEVTAACSPIFTQSIYGNLDYYLEILQLWDKIPSFEVVRDSAIISGILFKGNLQAKIRREITQDGLHKIEEFLRECKNLTRMSNLLNDYTNPDNDSPLVLEKTLLKEVQLSYFMKYAEKGMVDEDCITLFVNCADIEPTSQKFLWNDKASAKLRELVDIDSQGYMSVFIINNEINIFPSTSWEPVFQKNPEELEKYLFAHDKDQLTGVNKARTVWRLYKNNGYKDIQVNDPRWKNLNRDTLIARLGALLDKMLKIKEEVEQIKIEADETIESEKNKVDRLQELREELSAIPLYITLNGDLSREIDQKISASPTITKMKDKLGLDN